MGKYIPLTVSASPQYVKRSHEDQHTVKRISGCMRYPKSQKISEIGQRKCHENCRKPKSGYVFQTKNTCGNCCYPGGQRRFFVAWFTIEGGQDPVLILNHLPGCNKVARLHDIDRENTQMRQKYQSANDQDDEW